VRGSFFLMGLLLAGPMLREPARLASWMLIVLVSVLIHELGHAMAFRWYGHEPTIELYSMGGVTRGSEDKRLLPKQNFVVSIAGPMMGFLVGVPVWVLVRSGELPPQVDDVARQIVWANVGWGVFNLMPIGMLDGGLALTSLLRAISPVRGELIALFIVNATAVAVAIAGLALGRPWIAFVAVWFSLPAIERLKRVLKRGKDHVFDEKLSEGWLHLRADRIESAKAVAEEVLAQVTNELVTNDALRLLGWAQFLLGDAKAAIDTLERAKDPSTADPLLYGQALLKIGRHKEAVPHLSRAFYATPSPEAGHALVLAMIAAEDFSGARALIESAHGEKLDDEAFAEVEAKMFFAGDFSDALAVSEQRFARFGVPDAAYNAACSAVRLEKNDEAITWLKRAIGAGYSDLEHMAKDGDLAPLRGRDDFAALTQRP
jgi:stage IV sporulation protein FB